MTTEIYMASDHAGFGLRTYLATYLREAGHIIHDLGPLTDDRVDYPDFGAELARAMKPVADSKGVLVCGSGIGISIAANRFPWIRAALCHDMTTAMLARQHNDANVVALGERITGITTATDIVQAFLETDFEGGRHEARVNKLSNLKP
jgi:ribose 5-phosphate isomerase B